MSAELVLYTHLQLLIFTPLWLSLWVMVAVMPTPVLAVVALNLIPATFGTEVSVILVFTLSPPLVPSHNLA